MPGDAQADEAARLEAALARIQAAARCRPNAPQAVAPGPPPHDIAGRLDTLIAELRALLAPPG